MACRLCHYKLTQFTDKFGSCRDKSYRNEKNVVSSMTNRILMHKTCQLLHCADVSKVAVWAIQIVLQKPDDQTVLRIFDDTAAQ